MSDRLRLKEVRELTRVRILLFLREPEAIFWTLVFPLVLALILGWAFKDRGLAPEKVGFLVLSEGATDARTTNELSRLEESELLEVERFQDLETANRSLRFGHIAILVMPGEPTTLRLDPQRPESELARLRVERALRADPLDYAVDEIRETGSRYIDWLFPGLLGMNLMGTGIWGIGFAIADMRQKKLLRRFLVTPMRRRSFLLSFILSRGVFLAGEILVLVLFAVFVLGVPMRGSPILFFVTCVAGALTFASLGILIASRARTIEGVSGLMNFAMLPMWLFSGVFFSYEKFPDAVHPVIQALPLTALNDALRSVMLEGGGLDQVAIPLAVQLAWAVLAFGLAIRIFRWE